YYICSIPDNIYFSKFSRPLNLGRQAQDSESLFYTIYTCGTENCEKFEEKLAKHGYAINGRLQVGATIGAHIGPDAFGVVFVARQG
ncbi:MAG: hypothetical protein HFI46_08875, partial [Lachnospiraceae bacterium]|nr:hypothetical protein [Lachnospiraceae bacterium]